MLSLQLSFRFERDAVAYAMLKRTSVFELLCKITAPRYLKLGTGFSFCPFYLDPSGLGVGGRGGGDHKKVVTQLMYPNLHLKITDSFQIFKRKWYCAFSLHVPNVDTLLNEKASFVILYLCCENEKRSFTAYARREDADQYVHTRSLIRIFPFILYSRTSVARTLMARLLRLFRTRS